MAVLPDTEAGSPPFPGWPSVLSPRPVGRACASRVPLLQVRDPVHITSALQLPAVRLTPSAGPPHLRPRGRSVLPSTPLPASRPDFITKLTAHPHLAPMHCFWLRLEHDALSMEYGGQLPRFTATGSLHDRPVPQARHTADRVSGFALFLHAYPCMPPNQVPLRYSIGFLCFLRPHVWPVTPLPFDCLPSVGVNSTFFRWTGCRLRGQNKIKNPAKGGVLYIWCLTKYLLSHGKTHPLHRPECIVSF